MRQTKLQGVNLIDLPTFEDDRGFFREVFHLNELEAVVGRRVTFVRMNHSRSQASVLRGIHVAPFEKLIYVTRGMALCVLVDARKNSPSYGQYEMIKLGDANRQAVYLPAGIGNAFYAEEETDYVYLVTAYYDPVAEKTIRWDDSDLAIPWPNKNPIISDRDKGGMEFRQV